jgi:hypothetical protein
LLTLIALTALSAAPVAGQAFALRETPPPRAFEALADAYRVRLRSVWPQLGTEEDCANGGDEIVEGTLNRSPDGGYRGTFTRRTRILFCGAHGTDGEACELVLEGDGRVAAAGALVADEASPSGHALRLGWRPLPTHAATVRGACSADFKRSAEAMYLSVRHGAEFALPADGEGRLVERLENYPWIVEVE